MNIESISNIILSFVVGLLVGIILEKCIGGNKNA